MDWISCGTAEQAAEKGLFESFGRKNLPVWGHFMPSKENYQPITEGFSAFGCHDLVESEFFSSLLMPVEDHMRAATAGTVMANDHRVTRGWPYAGVQADDRELNGKPFCRCCAGAQLIGIG